MMRVLRAAAVAAMLATAIAGAGAEMPRRAVAITIDDLPKGGDGSPPSFDAVYARNERLLRPFKEGHVPVIGFVNAQH